MRSSRTGHPAHLYEPTHPRTPHPGTRQDRRQPDTHRRSVRTMQPAHRRSITRGRSTMRTDHEVDMIMIRMQVRRMTGSLPVVTLDCASCAESGTRRTWSTDTDPAGLAVALTAAADHASHVHPSHPGETWRWETHCARCLGDTAPWNPDVPFSEMTHIRPGGGADFDRNRDHAPDFSRAAPPRTPAPCSFSLPAPISADSSGPITARDIDELRDRFTAHLDRGRPEPFPKPAHPRTEGTDCDAAEQCVSDERCPFFTQSAACRGIGVE